MSGPTLKRHTKPILKSNRNLAYWIPALIWMGIIFIFSSRTRVQVSDSQVVQFLFFKTLHVIEYALLYLLVYRAVRNTNKSAAAEQRLNAIIYSVFYGLSDEIHQVFIPTREGRLRDVGIDTLGIMISFYIIWKLLPKAPLKLRRWAEQLRII